MNGDPLELVSELESVVTLLNETSATEANLDTIKKATACGFRAIAENIKNAYSGAQATKVPQAPTPAPEVLPPVPTVTGHAPEQQAAATEDKKKEEAESQAPLKAQGASAD